VARWWTLEEFESIRVAAAAMGFAHVQSSPLTRSSYHARQAVEASAGPPAFEGDDPDGARPADDPGSVPEPLTVAVTLAARS
jgi:hypothetical protein